MGGSKTYVPYPSFYQTSPSPSSSGYLPAVGRCRVYPLSCCQKSAVGQAKDEDKKDGTFEFQAIVDKAVEQSETGECTESDKKARKKCMKEGVAMAQSYLRDTLGVDTSIVDVEIVLEGAAIVGSDGCVVSCFLDAGCDRIVLAAGDAGGDGWQEAALRALEMARVPRDRLVLQLREETVKDRRLADCLASAAVYASTVTVLCASAQLDSVRASCDEWIDFMPQPEDKQLARFTSVVIELALDTDTDTDTATANDDLSSEIMKHVTQLASDNSTTIQHGVILALRDTTALQLGNTYASCIKTDRPDKLYTTVVCTRSNEALGLVYSSTESIVAALQCGRGVYYSRSRNGLWRKGDTSGMYQTLHRIDVDCDGDALRFTVTQRGGDGTSPAFCHLGTLTCWGEPTGMRHLEGTLRARMDGAPEGSYTKRLFEDGELLRDKLVEEAQELAEAVDKKHVAEELADVLYFAMVKAAKAGVSIDDAAVELDKRRRKVTRRKGDSKAFRIEAGDAILKNK